jgi:hypothetical protein
MTRIPYSLLSKSESVSFYNDPRPAVATDHYLGSNHDEILAQLFVSEPTRSSTAANSAEMINSLLEILRIVQEYAQREWSVADELCCATPPPYRQISQKRPAYVPSGMYQKGNKLPRKGIAEKPESSTHRVSGKTLLKCESSVPQKLRKLKAPLELYHIPIGDVTPEMYTEFPALCAQPRRSGTRRKVVPSDLSAYRTIPMVSAESVYETFVDMFSDYPQTITIPIASFFRVIRPRTKPAFLRKYVDHVHENIRMYGTPRADGSIPSKRLPVTDARDSETNKGLFPVCGLHVFEGLIMACKAIQLSGPDALLLWALWECLSNGHVRGLPPPVYTRGFKCIEHAEQLSYALTKWIKRPERTDSPFGQRVSTPAYHVQERVLWAFLPFCMLEAGLSRAVDPRLRACLNEKELKISHKVNPTLSIESRIWKHPGVRVVFYKTTTDVQHIKDLLELEHSRLLSDRCKNFEMRGDQLMLKTLTDAAVSAKHRIVDFVNKGNIPTAPISSLADAPIDALYHPDKPLTVAIYDGNGKSFQDSYIIPEERVYFVTFDM